MLGQHGNSECERAAESKRVEKGRQEAEGRSEARLLLVKIGPAAEVATAVPVVMGNICVAAGATEGWRGDSRPQVGHLV